MGHRTTTWESLRHLITQKAAWDMQSFTATVSNSPRGQAIYTRACWRAILKQDVCGNVFICTSVYRHTCKNMHVHEKMCTHAQALAYLHLHALTYTLIHTRASALAHIHTHARARARTHARIHTQTQTRIQTCMHTCPILPYGHD